MKVLFLIDNLRPGGAQKALLATAKALRAAGSEPAVWCLGGSSEIEADFHAAGVPVLGKSKTVLGVLREPFALAGYLRRERVELVQTFLFHADVTGRIAARWARLFRRGRRPVVVSSVRATNVRNRWWQFLLLRLTAPLADAFTAVSQRTLEFAVRREGVKAGRAAVIPNGIDVAGWPPEDPRVARSELDLPPEACVILTVGRLHEQKGHEYLLRAAQRVCAEAKDALFLIAGYGPLEQALKARAAQLGLGDRVRFLGYRKDVHRLLAAADVFVLPSLWEGMSNAILEAMAAGKPVVATYVDGSVEQVAHGDTGLLAPPADADALADALLKLARNREQAAEMGRRGREKAEREFALDRMTQAYLDLYGRLLAERAPQPAVVPAKRES